jgi:putative N6-adenine-specific DNA methylase
MSHVTTPGTDLACFAVVAPGLEALVAEELRALGATQNLGVEAPELGGVGFRTDRAGLYAANLHLRVASRVLVRVGSFHAATFHELERHARRLPWGRFVGQGREVVFRVTSRKSRLYHQEAVAERLLGALTGGDPGGAAVADGAAQEFVVRLYRDECTVSADASGELLHRRGYRVSSAKAPLRETLAAAMLAAAGWNGQAPLLDPMCGSGTIPIEAALLARRIAPGLGRGFAFEHWPEFDRRTWDTMRVQARELVRPRSPVPIQGSDRDAGAVAAAAGNAERAGVGADVEWRRAAISAIEPPASTGWIVTNPPYGVRVGDRKRLRDLYAQFGNVLRAKCPGWQVALLTARPELERQTGLPLSSKLETSNGGIPVRLMAAHLP